MIADTELATLRNVRLEQKDGLEEQGLVSVFTKRLIREYAIEGAIIERAYTLDRGITQLLSDRGIDATVFQMNYMEEPNDTRTRFEHGFGNL